MLWNTLNQSVELGWDFYLPVILFVALIALAVPVWAAIGMAAIVMLVMSGDMPLSAVGESLFTGIDAFALTAVPLFILTGDVLVRTGLSRKFLDVAEALTCWAKGGFGSATVLVCGMFAAISGSDAAGAAAVGRMTIDRLVESGYPRPYACALVAAGACTGILIPPSIAYIIIGLVLGISASTLFLAALIPGICILVSILVTNIVMNRLYSWEGGNNFQTDHYGPRVKETLRLRPARLLFAGALLAFAVVAIILLASTWFGFEQRFGRFELGAVAVFSLLAFLLSLNSETNRVESKSAVEGSDGPITRMGQLRSDNFLVWSIVLCLGGILATLFSSVFLGLSVLCAGIILGFRNPAAHAVPVLIALLGGLTAVSMANPLTSLVILTLSLLAALFSWRVMANKFHGLDGGKNGLADYFLRLGSAICDGWYAFIVPGIIFYGIFSGRLTPTEAGATAVVVTIIMGFLLRTLKLSDFPAMLISSAKVNGVILPIIAFSAPLAEALAIMGVPQGFVGAVTAMTDDPNMLILLMILILIAAGCVMETTPNIVILAPILKPLADNIGMNEIQFCIMMITALGVGFITPPLGLNLFVVSGITGESILKIAARAVPFVFFMLLVTLMIAYIPAISTTMLPDIYK